MTRFLTNRDGGKTDEKGHLKYLHSSSAGEVFTGGVASQNGTPNMTINVSALDALIRDAANGYAYHVWSDSVENVQVATANASNARKDYLIAYVDRAVSPNPANANNAGIWKLVTVAGTPAGSPTYPSVPQIQASPVGTNPYIILAGINVAASTTTITNGAITDLRSFYSPLVPKGGTLRGYDNDGNLIDVLRSGWFPVYDTWTYNAWNATTRFGVIAGANMTSYLNVDDRVMFNQATGGTKYGIVMAVTASLAYVFFPSGTTFTNEAITAARFSKVRSPLGFNSDPALWTLRVKSTATIGIPTNNVWTAVLGLALGRGNWTARSRIGYQINGIEGLLSLSTNGSNYSRDDFVNRDINAAGTLRLGQHYYEGDFSSSADFGLNIIARSGNAMDIRGDTSSPHISFIEAFPKSLA